MKKEGGVIKNTGQKAAHKGSGGKAKERNIKAILLFVLFIVAVLVVIVMAGYIDNIERSNASFSVTNEALGNMNAEMQRLMLERDKRLESLGSKMNVRESIIEELKTENARQKQRIAELEKAFSEKNEELARLAADLGDKVEAISALKAELQSKASETSVP